jgi:hypothetical protein
MRSDRALEDALSPVAQRALDAMFHDYGGAPAPARARAMECTALLDRGDKPASRSRRGWPPRWKALHRQARRVTSASDLCRFAGDHRRGDGLE